MKQKISRFEFAIMETITPEEAKNFEPRTEQEEINLRQQNLLNQVKNLVIADVVVPKGTLCDHDWQFIGSVGQEHCHKCDTWSDMCD